ncbi:MAG: hypothetical protein ACXWJW_04715 [Xanthobacteraceae bacterium]
MQIFLRLFAAILLLLPAEFLWAASPAACNNFALSLVNAAQKVKAKGGCDQNMNDPFWSTNKAVQVQWCLGTSDETLKKRLDEMGAVSEKCSYCQLYADYVSAAAVYNIQNKCGYKYDGDGRWNPDRQFHFSGCMKFESCFTDAALLFGAIGGNTYCTGDLNQQVGSSDTVKTSLDAIAGDVGFKIEQCKATRASSQPLTVQKDGFNLRDSFERLKRFPNVSAKTGIELNSPPDTTNLRKKFPAGSAKSGNDLAEPSDNTRRVIDPCRSATTGPCTPSTNVLTPSLLESDPGFTRQGPAAAGSPAAPVFRSR